MVAGVSMLEINLRQMQRAHKRVRNLYAVGLSGVKINAYAREAARAFKKGP